MVTTDLPQSNDIAGVLRYNTNFGYYSCKVSKNELTNITFEICPNKQYHQITNQEFKHINEQSTNLVQLQISSQYGLRLLPGPLDSTLHNRYQYMLKDAYHAIAEKIVRILDCTYLILTKQGENNMKSQQNGHVYQI
ncbi:hypothetical protein C2G38_2209986 [Gigaspora rosea]|uniref:Uncharacterized protein n=1 Tax=Gigaspora rosea TaxID=44941 RepID=A0A397UFU1_9GLOM|nr:hypothetical protein C2G38_2209986 [Gigaspora rosea]